MIASLQYAMQILFAVFMVTAMFVMLPRASAIASAVRPTRLPEAAHAASAVARYIDWPH